jgi:hypothetical protein
MLASRFVLYNVYDGEFQILELNQSLALAGSA